ncbi:MAG: AtpZ/AtpI family protein [Planctomycetia bacterium]|nr:AtpZ/AtpI family protein [Planctomycetia bacterium]
MKRKQTTHNPYLDEDAASGDLRAKWAIGFAKASEITGISLQAILPALFGAWLDKRYNLMPFCLLVGFALGMLSAGLSLMKMVKDDK